MDATFTGALIRWQKDSNLSGVQVAKRFNYHPSLISMYLNQKRKMSLATVQQIYRILPSTDPLKSVALDALKGELPL